MNYSEAVNNCYGQGGHLARIDSEEMNLLIADFAEQSDRNVHMKELLWLDYSYKDDTWSDRRGNRPEYVGFENETLLEFTRVYEDWQDCALINYKSLGRWINEFCNARFILIISSKYFLYSFFKTSSPKYILNQGFAFGPGRQQPDRASLIFGLRDRARGYRDSRGRAETHRARFSGSA